MSLLEYLPHAADFRHSAYANDEIGGDTAGISTYAASEPAWVQPASQSKIMQYAAGGQRVTHAIYLRRNPGLRVSDTVVVKSGPYANRTMYVVDFAECTVGMDLLWLVMTEVDRQLA